jgi:phosphoglycolate phosphatase
MKKAVIFDLDGTLIDSLEDIAINANKVLEQLHCPTHSLEQYKYFVGDGAKVLIQNAMPKYISQEYLQEALALFIEYYEKNLHTKTKLYDGIRELLNILVEQNIPIAVLSNKPDKFTKLYVEKLLGDIPFVVVSAQKEGVEKKPHPIGAFEIAKKFQIEPKNIYFVGDTATDMKTAKNANMIAVGVSWGFRGIQELEKNGADFIIRTPEELLTKINR